MHRSLAAWLIENPWQAAVVAACLGMLSLQGAMAFVIFASAIPVLITLEQGPRVGGNVVLAIGVAVTGALMWYQQALWLALSYTLVLFGLPTLLGELLRRSGSLNLVFQLGLVLALLAVAMVFLFVPQPNALWEQVLGSAFVAISQSGIQLDATLVPQLARTMWGAMVAILLLAILSTVFLARWWQSLIHEPGAFGREFVELRSGVTLGVMLVLIVLAALFTHLSWLDCMAWIAMLGLALQGLASAHRRKVEGQLPRGWLVAIYVMMIVPLFSFVTVALLAGWGLADFWRRLRITSLRT
ncbi:MAG: hypothetical protein AB7F79_06405 [Steroidobacteraceae bacterium]